MRAIELRVGAAHFAHEGRDELEHQRVFAAEHVGVAHRAAHNAAEHIAAAFVAREYAIGDEEGARAQVIGDYAVAHCVSGRIVFGEFLRGMDQCLEEVDVVIVVLALEDGGDAFEAHTGVDAGFAGVLVLLLVLHEDEVPDFDEAVAIFTRRAGRTAWDVGAVIVENFGARTAGACIAHRPEIIIGGTADNFFVGQAGDFFPEIEGFVIGVVDGDAELLGRNAPDFGNQLPGVGDGALLEVIAEAEIAEHFKKRMVARGIADIVEIVMLAASTDAFLRGRGTGRRGRSLEAGEDVFELVHAGIRKHQRRVVMRHE